MENRVFCLHIDRVILVPPPDAAALGASVPHSPCVLRNARLVYFFLVESHFLTQIVTRFLENLEYRLDVPFELLLLLLGQYRVEFVLVHLRLYPEIFRHRLECHISFQFLFYFFQLLLQIRQLLSQRRLFRTLLGDPIRAVSVSPCVVIVLKSRPRSTLSFEQGLLEPVVVPQIRVVLARVLRSDRVESARKIHDDFGEHRVEGVVAVVSVVQRHQ